MTSAAISLLTAAAMFDARAAAKSNSANQPDSFDYQLPSKVNHILVIYQENWGFDSLYGQFPGVNGLQNAFDTLPQKDKSSGYNSYIYQTPQPTNGTSPYLRFPPGNGQPALPLIPYDLTKFVADTDKTGDIMHRFYRNCKLTMACSSRRTARWINSSPGATIRVWF